MGWLFVHLKLTTFQDFSVGIAKLENINSPKKVCQVDHVFLIAQSKFENFFSQKIKKLN